MLSDDRQGSQPNQNHKRLGDATVPWYKEAHGQEYVSNT